VPQLAIVLLVVFLVVTLFVRIAVAVRQTGSTGLLGLREGAGALEVGSGVVFVAGNLIGGSSPVLVLTNVIDPIGSIDTGLAHVVGVILAAGGIAIVFAAQMGMGSSWRIGVSEDQDTDLVTGGLFTVSRNPIYAGMFVAWIGFFFMVPTVPAIVGGLMVVLALEGQVRLVEEPFMRRTHGDYAAYERRVGRFLPGIGRRA
jgi:protein-S-isoprenylcysteine O-methyltransferase Ste14